MAENTNEMNSKTESPEAVPPSQNGAGANTGPTPEERIKAAENKYLYLYADFENFRKRVQKERVDLMQYGWESVARELLGVLDNLDRAVQHGQTQNLEGQAKGLLDGVQMVARQFQTVIESAGVKRIESLNKTFDPMFHEAVSQEASEKPAGTIVAEHAPGYMLHQRLLRPSRVVVSLGLISDSLTDSKPKTS
jgi:molecular chaperone GrpE